jgi:protein-glucosylgalactosylhydroxylysine glucosidase
MNGLYNGHKGLSHRARIPNLNNIQLQLCSATNYDSKNCFFTLNVKQGIFKTVYLDPDYKFKIEQTIYAHRLYNRVLVNDVNLIRLNSLGNLIWN